MRRFGLALVLLFGLALARDRVIIVNQTHIFHAPIPMTRVVGALGGSVLGGLDPGLATTLKAGGFLDYRDYRLRMNAAAAVGLSGARLCYAGALDWFRFPLEAAATYRLRAGGGAGLRLCYPAGGGGIEVRPLIEGILNLQFQVIPNVIGDVSFSLGYPEGLLGSVGFALAF